MKIEELENWYANNFEEQLKGRYIHLAHIENLIASYTPAFTIEVMGESVKGLPIYKMEIGRGGNRVLIWSQMHGNESTTTKAVFDLFKLLTSDNRLANTILSNCTLCILPMLNPDGAKAYTRVNANEIDLNRDAQYLSQPESNVLRDVFNDFKPDFCFNLHDQRTIFSAGNEPYPATVSFLTPAEDEERTITEARKKSMEIIAAMNHMLQQLIPNQVGRYDDGFNLNCVGDTFQSLGVPTLLFESGHYQKDYQREKTREYICYSLIEALKYISLNKVSGDLYEPYFEIPENDKLFYDIIIRNYSIIKKNQQKKLDVGILFKEILNKNTLTFVPHIEKIDQLHHNFGHIDCTEDILLQNLIEIDEVEFNDVLNLLKTIQEN